MGNKNKLYWYCQIIGWLLFFSINGLLLITLDKKEKVIWLSVSLFCVLGFIITHLMRYFIRLFDILKKNFKKATGQMIIITIIFSIVLGCTSEGVDMLIGHIPKSMEKLNWIERILAASANSMLILLVWNSLYYSFHFIEKNRKQELDTIRLESLVKSLQLQTIKSHINPHFIFNSLNSIRALIDENPQRARTAITELSNILRSSMQVEKVETVSFSEELSIVKDYLALEQIRFEERLHLDMQIDPNTLHLPIPPMMLQTLVENAIKHGISKEINGGKILITSKSNGTVHEIIVENTGKLNEDQLNINKGFGIKSVEDQLQLLYRSAASFSIQNNSEKANVKCRITIPITE